MDIMLDLETLSLKPTAAILTLGAVAFRRDGPVGEVLATHKVRIDLLSCVLAGLTIDDNTVGWWGDQSPEARAALFVGESVTLMNAVSGFNSWCYEQGSTITVWANGPTSDVVWWENACRAVGGPVPWSFRNVRDFRTIWDLADFSDERTQPTVAHDALEDALAQARDVQRAYRRIRPEPKSTLSEDMVGIVDSIAKKESRNPLGSGVRLDIRNPRHFAPTRYTPPEDAMPVVAPDELVVDPEEPGS